MKKILVPTDFSPNANKALDYAIQIAKRNQADIYLVHASNLLESSFPGDSTMTTSYNEAVTKQAYESLELLRKSIEDTEDVLVNTQLYNGTVKETILFAAKEHQIDLIVMGTLGQAGIKEKIFGSKTASIIGKTKIPLLAIPLEYDWSLPVKFLLAIHKFEEKLNLLNPVFDLAIVFGAHVQVGVFTDEDEAVAVDYMANAREVHQMEERLADRFRNISIQATHLSGHRFGDTLNEYIREQQIDLLAMITHERSFPANLFDRSLTKRMSYHSKVPLLAIPS